MSNCVELSEQLGNSSPAQPWHLLALPPARGGSAPWTNGGLSQHVMAYSCCDMLATGEQWGAYVDNTNTCIALYPPPQFPNSKGFTAYSTYSTLQFTPMCPFTWEPGSVLAFDTDILVGPLSESHAPIYSLHSQQTSPGTLPPMGCPDAPANGDVVSGTVIVDGWSCALPGMAGVDVFVDGNRVDSATYGVTRSDIPIAFPGAPSNVGFQDALDTTAFSNGSHLWLSRRRTGTDTSPLLRRSR